MQKLIYFANCVILCPAGSDPWVFFVSSILELLDPRFKPLLFLHHSHVCKFVSFVQDNRLKITIFTQFICAKFEWFKVTVLVENQLNTLKKTWMTD